MTEKEFNLFFKRFKRYLKEKGRYDLIKYFLPKGKRTKKDLFNSFKETGFCPANIFSSTALLGPSYKKYGFSHWLKNLDPLRQEWESRYDLNYYKYNFDDFNVF